MSLIDTTKISADWLLTGQGEMYPKTKATEEIEGMVRPRGGGAKTIQEINELMQKLKPEQQEEMLMRSWEMVKFNDMENTVDKLLKKVENLEGQDSEKKEENAVGLDKEKEKRKNL